MLSRSSLDSWPDLEIGWTLRSKFWGRGYATEAAAESIRYAFTALDRPRIISLSLRRHPGGQGHSGPQQAVRYGHTRGRKTRPEPDGERADQHYRHPCTIGTPAMQLGFMNPT